MSSTKSIQLDKKNVLPQDIGTDYNFKRDIVWFNAIGFLLLHLGGLYGLYLTFISKWATIIWGVFIGVSSVEGVTIGAHRLYSHKAYKAAFSVRFVLIFLHTVAGQNSLFTWVRDHRLHHKYSDTDADPHNANRGFFFSHIGWLMSKKHPLVLEKGKSIDMSDLLADPLVVFQKTYYAPLYIIFAVIIPVAVPVYFWGEALKISFFSCFAYRYIFTLNGTWSINSVTHMFGNKPYNSSIRAAENLGTAILSFGEGWHNYHHVFPSDYKGGEFGLRYSPTTFIIETLAYFGLAYDLKEANPEKVRRKINLQGDGTHPNLNTNNTIQKAFEEHSEKVNCAGDYKNIYKISRPKM